MDSPIRPPIKISAPRSRQWSLIAWLSAAECFMRAMCRSSIWSVAVRL